MQPPPACSAMSDTCGVDSDGVCRYFDFPEDSGFHHAVKSGNGYSKQITYFLPRIGLFRGISGFLQGIADVVAFQSGYKAFRR